MDVGTRHTSSRQQQRFGSRRDNGGSECPDCASVRRCCAECRWIRWQHYPAAPLRSARVCLRLRVLPNGWLAGCPAGVGMRLAEGRAAIVRRRRCVGRRGWRRTVLLRAHSAHVLPPLPPSSCCQSASGRLWWLLLVGRRRSACGRPVVRHLPPPPSQSGRITAAAAAASPCSSPRSAASMRAPLSLTCRLVRLQWGGLTMQTWPLSFPSPSPCASDRRRLRPRLKTNQLQSEAGPRIRKRLRHKTLRTANVQGTQHTSCLHNH